MKASIVSEECVAVLLLAACGVCGPGNGGIAADLAVGPGQPFTKIQDAIDAASDADSVLVREGTYAEAVDFKGKKIRVASVSGTATTIIDATGIARAAVVTFKTAETAESVLEGFTLTGGSGALLAGSVLGGGGVFIDRATPVIRNCVIKKNSATRGGGILVQGVGAGGRIEGCEVSENISRASTGLAGGGIAVVFSGANPDQLTIERSRFLKNTVASGAAALGGGAYLGGTNVRAKVIAVDSSFNENLIGTQAASMGEGGGLYLDTILVEMEGGEVSGNLALHGGGIAVRNAGAASFIRGVQVTSNFTPATGGGGGFYFPAAGTSRITLAALDIADNRAGTAGGGGLWVEAGGPILESCRIAGNSSSEEGGAARFLATVKTKVNACLFLKNRATGPGGALYLSSGSTAPVVYSNCIFAGNTSSAEGGAVFNRAPSAAAIVKFYYCTFQANTATRGVGGIHYDTTVTTAAVVSNCILWANTPSDYPADVASAGKISYSDVKLPATFPASRPGMLSLDPLFAAAGADPPDFHLQSQSPLVDRGSEGTDLDGKPPALEKDFDGKSRITDGDGDGKPAPDLGAYEVEGGAVSGPRFRRGDANDDGQVDVSDTVTILNYQFLAGEKPKCFDAADADDTGAIDLSDPILLLNYLFLAGELPHAPGPINCGADPAPDALDPCVTTSC